MACTSFLSPAVAIWRAVVRFCSLLRSFWRFVTRFFFLGLGEPAPPRRSVSKPRSHFTLSDGVYVVGDENFIQSLYKSKY